MKPVANVGTPTGRVDTSSADAGQAPEARRSESSPPRQRVGANAALDLLPNPRPAAHAGEPDVAPRPGQRRASFAPAAGESAPSPAAAPLTNASEHSAATVKQGSARTRVRSFDDTVQVRTFVKGSPARVHSDEGEMPLRIAAHPEGPRRSRRPQPQTPQVPTPAASTAPLASRWDSTPQVPRAAGGLVAPRRSTDDEADAAPADSAPVRRSDSASAPRRPVRRPDADEDGSSI